MKIVQNGPAMLILALDSIPKWDYDIPKRDKNMDKQKYYCLFCGEWLESRTDTPEERQCSNCRRRKGLISEQEYRRGIESAKRVLKGKKPKVPPLQAIEDVADILTKTFPSPLIPGKTLIHIVKMAQQELQEERARQQRSDKHAI